MTSTDEDLLRLAAAGDQRAFGQLYDRHSPVVFRYGYALIGSPQETGEVVQDTFLTLWRRAGRARLVAGSLAPWLITTCRNHCMNMLRRRQRQIQAEGAIPENLAYEPRVTSPELVMWVNRALDELAPQERQMIELAVFDGLPYKAVAARLEITPQAARKRMQRLRLHLRSSYIREVE